MRIPDDGPILSNGVVNLRTPAAVRRARTDHGVRTTDEPIRRFDRVPVLGLRGLAGRWQERTDLPVLSRGRRNTSLTRGGCRGP